MVKRSNPLVISVLVDANYECSIEVCTKAQHKWAVRNMTRKWRAPIVEDFREVSDFNLKEANQCTKP